MTPNIIILFSVFAMILWGIEEFFLKQAITGIKSITTYFINTITGVVLHVLIVIFLFDFAVTRISGFDLTLALFASLLAFLGYFCFYLALEKQNLSLISSLDESWILISIFIAVLFFGERLGVLSIVSILAVLVGAFFISVNNLSSFKKIRFISGSGYELMSVFFIGLTIPVEKILVNRVGEANTLFYLAVFVIPIVFLAKLLRRDKFIKPTKSLLKISIYSGVADGLAFFFYLLAIKSANVSIVSPIVASNVIVTVFLAKIFLKEKMSAKEIFGAIIILFGVIILSTQYNF